MRRVAPAQLLKVAVVSDARLNNGGTALVTHAYDVGKYSAEALYSTDSGLVGVRGLWNFGPDPRRLQGTNRRKEESRISAGGELYYGALNKTVGISLGTRFTMLEAHQGVPLTTTLTLNPLMGNLSSTYAVKAGPNLTLCSRFDFNVYSYESDLVIGGELWRRRKQVVDGEMREIKGGECELKEKDDVSAVLKARLDQNWNIGLLWEGRVKEMLFSLGAKFDMRRRDQPFRAIGLELQYSS
jgi:distribution and morphology protein 10